MILELRAKNCFVFQNQIVYSLDHSIRLRLYMDRIMWVNHV